MWCGCRSAGSAATDGPAPAQAAEQAATAVSLLVVDDNQGGADTVAELMTMRGYQVKVAYDAACALQLADRARWTAAVAFVDFGLAVMDGYELAQAL